MTPAFINNSSVDTRVLLSALLLLSIIIFLPLLILTILYNLFNIKTLKAEEIKVFFKSKYTVLLLCFKNIEHERQKEYLF